jgi:hypothetical protein
MAASKPSLGFLDPLRLVVAHAVQQDYEDVVFSSCGRRRHRRAKRWQHRLGKVKFSVWMADF